jgi:hypothetical protein
VDRLTLAFVAFIMIFCGAFAAAPWQTMQAATIEGYADAPSGGALAANDKVGQTMQEGSSASGQASTLAGAAGSAILSAAK